MLYNFAADSFYIMKLCSRLFVLDCRSRPKYDTSMHFDPYFEEVGGSVEPWSMARWKAFAEFLLSVIELLFLSLTGIFFGFYKTRHILLSNDANCTVLRAVDLTQYRRVTDGQTDRRTDRRTELL